MVATRMMMISLWGNLKLSRGNVCVAVPLQTERFGGTDRSVLVLQDSAVETLLQKIPHLHGNGPRADPEKHRAKLVRSSPTYLNLDHTEEDI
ncbi:UDP-N-acetylmuramoylalanine--D-glutamate ligase [Dissostichus eleginoides]|uniref:UDP-N-acetylmuramoylalanine--D-glutamate ligase n=1 Tax=Dissostichus eleginoides TaxID=100907 RepID=A0AAD9FFU0_DISEL|nr:UDP-N-acetylmuramoylalanine--D-glutamate ligase [Dissostichus eleginoides]